MKKIIILIITTLVATPLLASLNCIDNSEHLQYGDYDRKMWHAVACDCPCTYVKGRRCVECGHLQEARPLTIVKARATKAAQRIVQGPQTVKDALNNLVQRYIKNNNIN